MSAALEPEPVPLIKDDAGRLIVAGTRVTLDSLVTAFKRGESPEGIHESYPTVALAAVYAALAYYLHHRSAIEAYLREQEELGAVIQARIEADDPPDGLRAKLMARLDS